MKRARIRILFIADTHLGFDLPFRPRVQRRRRGPDFFANFNRALQPALEGKADIVLHGGDLFYRSRIPDALVDMAFAPLIEVAENGIPVYLVPGNHERSKIPLHLWSAHPNLHIFTEPKSFSQEVNGMKVTLAGFPFARKIRDSFQSLVEATKFRDCDGDTRILCMHQTVEGAQVGPSDYTFRFGPDVIRGRDIPDEFAMILSGHIHRAQVLSHDLEGNALGAPVIYPGSVERTSFAERDEEKQYVIVKAVQNEHGMGELEEASFITLPARPMVTIDVEVEGKDVSEVNAFLEAKLAAIDPDSIVRIKPQGKMEKAMRWIISAKHLRTIAPESMNVSVSVPRN